MKAMQTRIYTNVILTVIALLLAALALQPVMDVATTAYAQRSRDVQIDLGSDLDPARGAAVSELGEQADAMRDIASAIKDLAAAVQDSGSAGQESAAAQREIADAIRSLGNL